MNDICYIQDICNDQDHLDDMTGELKVVLLLRDESVVKVAEVETLVGAHLHDQHDKEDGVDNAIKMRRQHIQ